tara:strand:- start:1686 stop:2627 length:942 start_codon:yes stop_codon:yes gene_type:complete
MDKNDIRLNQAKRKAIKDAWKDTIWKRTPTEFDSKLSDAVANFKQHESDVWNSVVKPIVEKNFPPEDMKVLQKYSRGSSCNSFSEYDSCFYFKPSFSDDKERQFRFAYNKEDMTALHYDELINLGVNPNVEIEYENREKNPHYHIKQDELSHAIDDFNNPRYMWTSSYHGQYRHSIDESDVGRMGGYALLVPATGGCHSRTMMCHNESDWKKLNNYDVSRREMIYAQRDLAKHKMTLVNDMNMVVDQAKFLSEVKPYWIDIEDCVNFDDQNIGTAVSIVSEETKARLLASAKIRQAERDIVAVITTPKEKSQN